MSAKPPEPDRPDGASLTHGALAAQIEALCQRMAAAEAARDTRQQEDALRPVPAALEALSETLLSLPRHAARQHLPALRHCLERLERAAAPARTVAQTAAAGTDGPRGNIPQA